MNNPLFIPWLDEYNLGIPIIDDQHHGIISIINTLYLFVRHQKAEFFLSTAASMMDNYTKLHFATEEELLLAAQYPQLDDYKKLHSEFIRESFSTVNKSIRLLNPDLYLEFLKEWWVGHVGERDRLYADSVKIYLATLPDDIIDTPLNWNPWRG